MGPIDAVILAGGTGRRLGGASKPDVVARGARLIDHVLAGLEHLRSRLPLGRIVVVAPASVELPHTILRTLEDPPGGGPVAGIAAGLERLARPGARSTARLVAVLTCDAPEAWRALPVLARALSAPGAADGACVQEAEHVQYLVGIYRRPALAAAVMPGGRGLRDVPVRGVLGALRVTPVELPEGMRRAVRDLDTWEEIRSWEALAPQ